jgi:hypothetical protein
MTGWAPVVIAYQNENDELAPYPVVLETWLTVGPEAPDTCRTDEEILERVFRVLNRVDGWEPVPDGWRSLSVGDVVDIVRGPVTHRYVCAPVGWTLADEPGDGGDERTNGASPSG